MKRIFEISRNDTAPSIAIEPLNSFKAPVSLSGGIGRGAATSVQFHMTQGSTVKVNAAGVVDTTLNELRYDWVAADTDTAGLYDAEFEVTWADGSKTTYPTAKLIVHVIEDLA